MPITSPRLGVRGHARVSLRAPDGRLLDERVFSNIETQTALNAIAAWIAGGGVVVTPAYPSYLSLGVGPVNLLTADQASFESSAAGWQALSNCAVARSSTQAWDGSWSLALTASSGADMTAESTPGTGAVAAASGYAYAADAHFRAGSTGRSCSIGIAWFDTTGTLLSTSYGTAVSDTTSGWVRAGVVATAPASTAYAAVVAKVASAGASEVHYLDGVQLAYAPDSAPFAWDAGGQTPSPAVTDTRLYQELYQTRKKIDVAYSQDALAVLLHTYQQSDPAGAYTEAGLWDADADSGAYLTAQANPGDVTLAVGGTVPAVTAGTRICIPAAPLSVPGSISFGSASTTGGHLVGGTTYYYRVTAYDAVGETTPGPEASYAVPAGTNTNQITLTWTAVPGATGYKVYRSTSAGTEQLLASFASTTGSYVDNTATTPSGGYPTTDTSGGHQEYAVIAADAAAGASSWSLTDMLLDTHPARIVSGTTTINAPVVAFTGNLWAHVTLSGVSKTSLQLLSLQWEMLAANV